VSADALARALRLARISLAFSRVERVTRHEDGVRPETDSDHTVMLALIACELAPPSLDRSMVAAFAVVHDLVEVYAGDAQTLVISPEGRVAKQQREDAARDRLAGELGEGSWVVDLLTTYERQRAPEARFVRLLDKVLPKLTHALNGCVAALPITDRPGFVAAHARQLQQLQEEYAEFPEALQLLRDAMAHCEEHWPSAKASAPEADDETSRAVESMVLAPRTDGPVERYLSAAAALDARRAELGLALGLALPATGSSEPHTAWMDCEWAFAPAGALACVAVYLGPGKIEQLVGQVAAYEGWTLVLAEGRPYLLRDSLRMRPEAPAAVASVTVEARSCRGCKFSGIDPDCEPFCTHPSVTAKNAYGLVLRAAVRDYCGPELSLFVPRPPVAPAEGEAACPTEVPATREGAP